MLTLSQRRMAKAAVVLAALFILEIAGPAQVFGCPILLGGRHRRGCAPSCPPCPLSIPSYPVLESVSSFWPPEPADELLFYDVDPITPAAAETEQPADGESAADIGAIGAIRPTGFLPTFLDPIAGGSFAPGMPAPPLGFPSAFGGAGDGRSSGFGRGLLGRRQTGGLIGGSIEGSGESTFGPFSGGPGSGGSGDPGGNSGDPVGNGSGPGSGGLGVPEATTPEPSTLVLLSIGIVGLSGMAWGRRAVWLRRAKDSL